MIATELELEREKLRRTMGRKWHFVPKMSIEQAKAELKETLGRKPPFAADVEDAKAELRETMANLRRERGKVK